ncbi:hypothetical protein MHU86_21335 [Fragilaria crotonensis]|nr:hypothetical protein MHU86_21335 [Fragilaria crotonensis]
MGNAQPTNKTGRKVVVQKLENAKKTNVLSLREHKIDTMPEQVLQITTLRTLDVSKNNLKSLGQIDRLPNLKSLNCKENQIPTLGPISKLSSLQTLSAGSNLLGKLSADVSEAVPTLPASLKQLALDHNFFSSVPMSVVSSTLTKLEKLDLSFNQLAVLPADIANLVSLEELKADHNMIVSLPETMGRLTKLKTLSLKGNSISVTSTIFSPRNPQPLPASLFTDTPLIDLNLHGNRLTSTELNQFDGFPAFLSRREKVKTKDLYGGAMTNFDVCGLE